MVESDPVMLLDYPRPGQPDVLVTQGRVAVNFAPFPDGVRNDVVHSLVRLSREIRGCIFVLL